MILAVFGYTDFVSMLKAGYTVVLYVLDLVVNNWAVFSFAVVLLVIGVIVAIWRAVRG